MNELELIKQMINVLRQDMDEQGTRMQKDMEQLLQGMTQVVQNWDRRLSAVEKALKVNGLLADKIPEAPVSEASGKEL